MLSFFRSRFPPSLVSFLPSPIASFDMAEVAANDDGFIAENRVMEEPNQPRSIRQEVKANAPECVLFASFRRPGFPNEVDGKAREHGLGNA